MMLGAYGSRMLPVSCIGSWTGGLKDDIGADRGGCLGRRGRCGMIFGRAGLPVMTGARHRKARIGAVVRILLAVSGSACSARYFWSCGTGSKIV
jgi:hypothetical protein